MEVYIPSFRYEESDLERGYTVGAGRGGTGPREPSLRLLSPEGSSASRRPCVGLRGAPGVVSSDAALAILPAASPPEPGMGCVRFWHSCSCVQTEVALRAG
ncbi:hypothetical protein J1605_014845 [Eschrichtius robustus]|uniref:Uncharacterized protein n=1 Tax=Eschrichtius robustus TaxID=9764 RepID=A0AB34GDQ9_ESCRO|nr:hypothetical protein J1605_014845 [Eschrichtius robustus]